MGQLAIALLVVGIVLSVVCVEASPAPDTCVRDERVALVVLVTRHGARFPNRPMAGDYSWPTDAQFWKHFKAHLTPAGSRQLFELGTKLARRYRALFEGLAPTEMDDAVRCECSNTHRTLNSAFALLEGMFPDTPRYFRFFRSCAACWRCSRLPATFGRLPPRPRAWRSLASPPARGLRGGIRSEREPGQAQAANERRGIGLGIAITIQSQEKDDMLFHSLKTAPEARDSCAPNRRLLPQSPRVRASIARARAHRRAHA